MKRSRLTRQGVPDLNPPGHTNPKRVKVECGHIYREQIVGYRYADWDGLYEEPVYAYICEFCGARP